MFLRVQIHRKFDPNMLNLEIQNRNNFQSSCQATTSSRGRVVKASDSKSDSLWERRFESYRLRIFFLGFETFLEQNLKFDVIFQKYLTKHLNSHNLSYNIFISSFKFSLHWVCKYPQQSCHPLPFRPFFNIPKKIPLL